MDTNTRAIIETNAGNLDAAALLRAKEAFLSEGSSLTIRRGVVTGEQNFHQRLTLAIAAYEHERMCAGPAR